MRKLYLCLCLLASVPCVTPLFAQAGCPGCVVSLPGTLPADTLYLADAPNGRAGEYYEADISFRMPKTTTPVAANDSTVAPNITISQINITSVSNLPPGLSWQANQLEFKVAEQTDGCVRFCGTPLQPGLYEVEVVVTAKVLIISQTTSFSFPILIEPAVSVTEGFTMENSSGCGEVQVSFQNNVPSGGQSGFSYKWDFGNGRSSLDENPGNQIYRQPGSYFVNYQAIIDTTGYFLTGLQVNEISCSDFLSRPDLYVELLSPQDSVIYRSEQVNNITLPYNVNLNVPIGNGNYKIRVIDDDEGLEGADDECGTAVFNRLSTGTLEGVDFKALITIIHPVDTIRSRDTVRVFAQPTPPLLIGYDGELLCKGDTVELLTNYNNNLRWYKNNDFLIGKTASILSTTETGSYRVAYTSPDGCQAFSDSVKLNFAEPPVIPIFLNKENFLSLLEPAKLPANYTAQWSLNGNVIAGANRATLCANASGAYSLKITDNITGCYNTYSRNITFNPNFAGCTTATEDRFNELVNDLTVFPNPTNGQLWLEFGLQEAKDIKIIIRNVLGAEMNRTLHRNLLGNSKLEMNLQDYPAGIYFIELQVEDELRNVKIIKQ
ncbi:MAG: T9SS type A sorting domain-containing protein [Saprospiraceae bacterium]